MIALRRIDLDFDPDALIRGVADRFAPPKLGVRLSAAELYAAGRAGLARGVASGRAGLARGVASGEDDPDALARHVEAEIRRMIPLRHLGLIAKSVSCFSGRCGMDDDDLWQEGYLGLMEAAARYEPERGWRFSTYATWWTRRYVTNAAVYGASLIRAPHHAVDEAFAAGDDPAGDDFAPGRNLTAKERKRAEERRRLVEHARRARRPITQESGLEVPLANLVPVDPDEAPWPGEAGARRVLDRLLADLDPADRAMVVERHGLDGGGVRKLREIGARHGLTKERIRQRVARATHQMRVAAERMELAVA